MVERFKKAPGWPGVEEGDKHMKEIKNTWSVAFLSLIAVGSVLQSTAVEAKDACKEPAPPAPCYSTEEDSCRRYCLGPENYAASAPVFPKTCGGDIIIGVDVMYARSELGGMALAVHTPSGSTTVQMTDQVIFPNYDYKLGGRIEVGYNATRDGWNFMGSWTRNYGEATDSYGGAGAAAGGSYGSLFSRTQKEIRDSKGLLVKAGVGVDEVLFLASRYPSASIGGANVSVLDSFWKMTTDIIDFSWSRSQWLSKYVETAPRVGLRLGRIEQEWRITTSVPSGGGPALGGTTLESTFKGAGAFFGFDTLWHICGSFGLYSHVALGSWYGRFDVEQREGSQLFFADFYTLRSFMENDFGLKWSAQFCDGSYGLFLSVGWETHIFYDQNPFYTIAPIYKPVVGNATVAGKTPEETVQALAAVPAEYVAPRRGDLATQGLVVKAHVLF